LVFSRSWVDSSALQAKLEARYEWLQSTPPQPILSIGCTDLPRFLRQIC
jgi:hypothetical protein